MNPAEWLIRAAARYPQAPALLSATQVVADYAGFARRAAGLATALRTRYGIEPGERVALFAKNSTSYLEALYGIWWCGAVAVPINGKLHPKEAAWIIGDCGARLAFVGCGAAGEMTPLCTDLTVLELAGDVFDALCLEPEFGTPHPTRSGDMVWLFYTSGTTGKPKGVMISAGNVSAMALSYLMDVDPVDHEDAIVYAAPMSHGAGIYNFMHVMRAARHVVPRSGGFDANEVLTLAAQIGNVSMFAAPTMVRRLIDAAKATQSTGEGIKTIVYGGGPMYTADIIEAVDVMGPRFVQIYGQGECPMAISALSRGEVADREHPNWRARLSSVGRAQSAVRLRIEGPDGVTLPPGEVGEIMVQGLPVMLGYWNTFEATARTIREDWLATGDMGALDADGYLTLHDRSKDVIISGGTNIYPREVEEALLTHPQVHEVAVVGAPDPEWGEVVVAFVVPNAGTGPTFAALDAHCLESIARFKRPKQYEFLTELPKNNYGKVLKTELRKRLSQTSS